MSRALQIIRTVLLLVIFVPLAAIAGLVTTIFGLKAKLTAAEVASYLRDFIEGDGDAYDWDDFTSVPIADPILEDIRKRALAIDLPPDQEGIEAIRALLVEAEGHASTDKAQAAYPAK